MSIRQRISRDPQPGQVLLAGPGRPLPDCVQPVVPGRGQRAQRDRHQTRQRVDRPPAATAGRGSPPAVPRSRHATPRPVLHRRHVAPLITKTLDTFSDLPAACLQPRQQHARDADAAITRDQLVKSRSRQSPGDKCRVDIATGAPVLVDPGSTLCGGRTAYSPLRGPSCRRYSRSPARPCAASPRTPGAGSPLMPSIPGTRRSWR